MNAQDRDLIRDIIVAWEYYEYHPSRSVECKQPYMEAIKRACRNAVAYGLKGKYTVNNQRVMISSVEDRIRVQLATQDPYKIRSISFSS